MSYNLYVFDLDGTILDTLDDLTDSFNVIANEFGFPPRTKAEVRSFMGNGLIMLAKLGAPMGTAEKILKKFHRRIAEYYSEHCNIKTKPYDGVFELLTYLKAKGCKIAVVSNKIDCAVKELCDYHFPKLIDCSVGEKDGVRKKPYPDAVNEVLKYFGILKEQAVYIGDTEVDFMTANNSHLDCALVTWGFRDVDVLAKYSPTYLINNVNEIKNI